MICNSSRQDINEVGFPAYYDFVFSQYPEQFKSDLIEYGREFAEQIFSEKKYRLFDPIVSDCACQMRAIWLCCFLRSVREIENVTVEDLVFFGLSRLLSESAVNVQHDIIGTAALKTKSSCWPESVGKLQNKLARERFYGEAKTLVAKRVLDDVAQWFSILTPDDLVLGRFGVDKEQCYQELCSVLKNFKPSSSYSQIPIPVLHIFPSLILALTLAANWGVVVSIAFRKVSRDGQGMLGCEKGKVSHFRYDKSLKVFEEIAVSELGEDMGDGFSYASNVDGFPEFVFSSYSWSNQALENDIVPEHFLESISQHIGTKISLEDCLYTTSSLHDDQEKGTNTIDEYPCLTELLEKYTSFSKSTNIKASDTVLRIYKAMNSGSLADMFLEDVVFSITHVYSDFLLQNLVD